MLSVEHLKVAYGESEIIKDLSFQVAPNEIVAVMGRNGMGKTTLMKSLMGIVPSSGGAIKVADHAVEKMQPYERVGQGLAYVPQGRMIFSTMTVKDNVETGLAPSSGKDVLSEIYTLFPVLLDMKDRRGGNLSGGQQQQLAIARALATQPDVLLLDEPTEGIQPSIIKEMARTLRRIRDEKGVSMVVSEQVLSFALDVADRVLVIEKGEIVHETLRADIDEEKVSRFLSI